MFRQAFRSSLSSSLRTTSTSYAARFPKHAALSPALSRFLSQDARSKIQDAVKEYPLVLFMKGTPDAPQCGFSRAVVQLLDINGVPPEKIKTYDVLEDQELRNGIKEFSEWPTIPQVYVNGEFVGGCDIVLGMHQSGDLEKLLQQHDIIQATKSKSPSA
ncbi:thioredoxin-like protein [Phellopilus nigrolimitatus]|nr:thioredoxin-like protein [Phellopilus nigrolimitatus]